MARVRTLINATSRPALPVYVRLRHDRLRGAPVVLAPEKVLWPDEVSADILSRCDGQATVEGIIDALSKEYAAPRGEIAEDVVSFLQDWADRNLIVCDGSGGMTKTGGSVGTAASAPADASGVGPPLGMLAELTHRCPLQCGYCSNPLELMKAERELSTEAWCDVFEQAADLGVLQVHLSGGEPTLRRDLERLVACLSGRGVYTNLITAAVTLTQERVAALANAGLDHVQVSFQGARPETTELVGRFKGAHETKRTAARWVREAGLPLTINAPIHRLNIDEVPAFVDLALELDAERLEIANVQYYGWAYLNRAALLPDRDAVLRQVEYVERVREELSGVLAIDFVTPDYHAEYPKPCMGGWAADAFVVTPDGTMLPCHAAEGIAALTFDRVGERPLEAIWRHSPAFNRFRGIDWMPEPCRSCPRKEVDFGGCRCQAFALTGDAGVTDPTCIKSPFHDRLRDLGEPQPIRPRAIGRVPEQV